MTELYIESFSGLSGDMLLSAFCGLADYYDEIVHLPAKLHLPDGKVVIEKVNKNGIVCKHVQIIDLNKDHHNHHNSHHEHTHDPQDHHHAHHAHRHLKDILQIIENGEITDEAKQIAKAIFTIIGKSESKIHDMDLDKIHFHEVSGVDSILDIVGCAVLIDRLQVNKTFSTPICTGFGMVKTQHGLLPVPAPATADILMNMPTYPGEEAGERVTPTGAAILKYLNPEFSTEEINREKIAYGPGKKNFTTPNVVRVSLVSSSEREKQHHQLIVVETNLDDVSSELMGIDFQKDLMEHGGIDFYFTSIHMKKGRPGLLLSVLAKPADLDRLSNFILENCSTIGLRYYPVYRKILDRTQFDMSTPYGNVQVKQVITPSGSKRNKIEYESLKGLKKIHGISILRLQDELYPLLSKIRDHE